MYKIILFTLFTHFIMFSQSEKQDLYIAYKDCTIHCIVKTENDTLIYENYQIRFGDKVKKESEFSVSAS